MGKLDIKLPILLLINLLLLVNLEFTAWPEMLLWPYLILKGWLPYRDIAIAHTPAFLLDLFIFGKIAGIGLLQLKIYTWALILLTAGILFWTARRLWNEKVAILALLFFILWQPFFEGNGLWFDLVLAPLAILIFYTLVKRQYLWSGILWALAFLTKQTAVWLLVPLLLSVRSSRWIEDKIIKKFAAGALAVFVLAVLLLLLLGILSDFFFWAIQFGVGILPGALGQAKLPALRQAFVAGFPFLIFLPLLLERKKEYLLLFAWAIFASAGIFPRFEFFHFQPAVPFLAIAGGLVLSQFIRLKRWVPVFLGMYFVGTLILLGSFYGRNWQQPTRFFEPEVLDVSSFIQMNTKPGEKIYLLNTWDHIYVLSGTFPATRPWIPTLSWYMELPGVQDEIVEDLKKEQPKLIVMEQYREEGLGSYKPEKVDRFISDNYEVKDVVANRFLILTPK